MGYRRDKQAALTWKRWRQLNEGLILSSGLPSYNTDTEENWMYFVMHQSFVPGYDYRKGRPLNAQEEALKGLVFSWLGGENTTLGQAFCMIEAVFLSE